MAVRLLNLRHMSEDEILGIRDLLADKGIDYYETPPGNWNISAGAIWLREEHQLQRAKTIVETFQHDYERQAMASYEERRRLGQIDTLLTRLGRQPARVLLYLAAGLLVLYLSTVPFLHMAH